MRPPNSILCLLSRSVCLTSLQEALQVDRTTISGSSGHLELLVQFRPNYYPQSVDEATMSVRWYTTDDFKIHSQEAHSEGVGKCRWDRHPNPHNTRAHFHPPHDARTPGVDESWPSDYRDVLLLILAELEERITKLWNE